MFLIVISTLLLTVSGYANPIRTVNVKAVGDEEFRERSDWKNRIRESIEQASSFFEDQFGIKFVLKETGKWNSDNSKKDLQSLLTELKGEIGKGNNDVVIGFTNQISNLFLGKSKSGAA